MSRPHDEDRDEVTEMLDKLAADAFAEEMDDMLLDIADLNPDICPPDRRYYRGNREAWVYEHGNIAELVFVKVE